MAEALVIIAGLLTVLLSLVALCLWKRWALAGMFACVLCVVVGLLLQPWSAIGGPSSSDPDEVYWLDRYRIASLVWLLCFVGCAWCLLIVIRDVKSHLKKHAA